MTRRLIDGHDLAAITDAEAPGADWRLLAKCRGSDPALFYIERGDKGTAAKTVCRECPVREACLEYALAAAETFGVWGGTSYAERKRMRRRRAAA